MTNIEKAVAIIVESFREDCAELHCETIGEYFKIMWMDSNDAKEEFLFILQDAENHGNIGFQFTDDCEIEKENGDFHTFRELMKAVRNYKFS